MSDRERYKRPFDLALTVLALVPLLPLWLLLGATVALAVRLEGRGPVLYTQARLGRGGRQFRIFKFRTMVEDAERHTGPVWATRHDARITAVGRVLRRFHLDELPQVVNIVRGEMSWVGPRPERPALAEQVERKVPGFSKRLQVRPGIAGLAQAQGTGGLSLRRKLRYDMFYIEKMNPWLDLRLFGVCVCKVLRRVWRHDGAGGSGPPARRAPGPGAPPAAPDARAGPPGPAAVRHNDWRAVPVPDAAGFAPTLPVSVVVPYFEAPEALALALAGLERQDYPRELFEVVIVDDGSRPPLSAPPSSPLEVRVVGQERRGFGLARARNAGARAAQGEVLVFLDGDVIAEAGLLAAHARWHHAVSDALTLGFCAYVSVQGMDAAAVRRRPASLAELFSGRPFDPPWLERHMARTGDLTSRHEDLFRAVTGHNFGISKGFFQELGGFDESFTRYGGEDTEFGYRAWCRGGLLVPAREAFGWHQGRWAEGRGRKRQDQDRQGAKLADLIAVPDFRRLSPGPGFTVPRHVVTIEAGDLPGAHLTETVADLLADPADDLVVRVETSARRADFGRLEERFGSDSRFSVAPAGTALEAYPVSPLHVTLPAGAAPGRERVRGLCAALGDAATATTVLADGSRMSVARTWALHRARRAGGTAADYGEARTVRGRSRAGRRRGVQAAARIWMELRHVRGLATGWRFLAWLAAAARWAWRTRRESSARPEARPVPARADAPLGAEIAVLGERARAVFRASSRVRHQVDGPVDAVLADTPEQAAGVEAPTVILEAARALAVPAFDPVRDNPVGWVREVEYQVAALGPTRLLAPEAEARRTVRAEDRAALRHCHHLEDTAAFHAGPVERAGTLARLAACGVPVCLADRDAELRELLGAELHESMTVGIKGADAAAREAISIRLRRAALRGHSLGVRARQVCAAARADPPELPRVSVLLATRRPGHLGRALANVARQAYPRLELVLALHGPGFEAAAVERALAGLAHPVKLLRLDGRQVFGAVLNAAAAAASGELLAKMDDDDLYGAEHLWDLVLAHEYSGAGLVGKFPATVYLAGLDRTVRQRRVRCETWSRSITGGAMLFSRSAFERAGGWRPLRRHVDQALIDDILRVGGGVYRTHDAGYLLVRHGGRHAWAANDADFLVEAEAVRPGLCPALAGLAELGPGPLGEGCAG